MAGRSYQHREVIFPTCVTEQTCCAFFHPVGLIELSLTVLRDTFWPKSRKSRQKNENIKPSCSRCTEDSNQKLSFSNQTDLVGLLGCKQSKSYGSKKLPAGVINFDSTETLKFVPDKLPIGGFKCLRRTSD